jgi:hypothetical protein
MVMAKGEVRGLTVRQRKGRAVNAVAELLEKRLAVPKIYLEPSSQYIAADVFAVDRAGAGDLHAVKIKLDSDFKDDRQRKSPADAKELNRLNEAWYRHLHRKIAEIHVELTALPAHYKYLAIPASSFDLVMGELGPVLYSPDGIGRIGIIRIFDRGDTSPVAELSSITPERFRVTPEQLGRIEKNLINNKKVRPDIEVRI